MPLILNDDVFINTINLGLRCADYFGFASSKATEKYTGFIFDERNAHIILDSSALLIEKATATAYKDSLKPVVQIPITDDSKPVNEVREATPTASTNKAEPTTTRTVKKHFHGSVELDSVKAKMSFADIVDEVIQHFATQSGVKVKISIEIEASSQQGFDDSVQRIIRENCNSLKFTYSEFED